MFDGHLKENLKKKKKTSFLYLNSLKRRGFIYAHLSQFISRQTQLNGIHLLNTKNLNEINSQHYILKATFILLIPSG